MCANYWFLNFLPFSGVVISNFYTGIFPLSRCQFWFLDEMVFVCCCVVGLRAKWHLPLGKTIRIKGVEKFFFFLFFVHQMLNYNLFTQTDLYSYCYHCRLKFHFFSILNLLSICLYDDNTHMRIRILFSVFYFQFAFFGAKQSLSARILQFVFWQITLGWVGYISRTVSSYVTCILISWNILVFQFLNERRSAYFLV